VNPAAGNVSGVRWMGVAQTTVAAAQVLQLVVLSRVLAPADFGIVATATVFIAFLQLFTDLGVSAAIVQQTEVTEQQLNSLVVLSGAVGAGLALILAGSSYAIAKVTGEPRLQPVLAAMSPLLLLAALTGPTRAANLRRFRYRSLALIDMAAAGAGAAVGIATGVSGLGVYSLVVGALAQSLAATVLNLRLASVRQLMQVQVERTTIRSFLRFGRYQMAQTALTYLHAQFDILLIGRLLGMQPLGVYAVARSICVRPLEVMNPLYSNIAFPTLARLQHDLAELREAYLRGLEILCTGSFFVYALLFATAEPLVDIVLGKSWDAAVPIVRILSIYFMLRSLGNPAGTLLLATGRVQWALRWNAAMFMFVPLAIWGGSAGGLTGVAWTMTALMTLIVIPMWWFLVRPCCGASFGDYHSRIVRPLALAAMAVGVGAWAGAGLKASIIAVVVIVGVSIVVYAALLRMLSAPIFAAIRTLLRC